MPPIQYGRTVRIRPRCLHHQFLPVSHLRLLFIVFFQKGFKEAENSAIEGGKVARVAREQLERKIGKKVISDKNAKEIRKLNTGEE